ncbi:MAG: hypothetical protein KF862_13510 [Chitinophagaceae bacterium]|nr:hypothetical protein [Chitinophagaceae bacterium]
MKHALFLMAATGFCILVAACRHGNTMVVDDGKNRLEINYSGEISFAEDETTIESMSPGAYLEFRSNNKKMFAKNNYHDEVEYELYEGRKRIDPLQPRGKELIAEAIKKMMDAGFNAEERIRHIYEKGGAIALLRATLKMEGDFLKSKYLSYLISETDPGVDELVAAAQITALTMHSGFEKAQVLKKFSGQNLSDQQIAAEWLKAAGTIDSDFEMTQALKAFPLGEAHDPEIYVQWIGVAKTVQSDFEKAQVLKEFPVDRLNDTLVSNAWFEATGTIDADFEKAKTLKILTNQSLNGMQFSQVLTTAEGISAEFEQVNLIKELIRQKVPSSRGGFDQLMLSVRNISGDFEKSNLLKAIIEKDIETEEQWSGILQETKTVGADFEKAGILLLIAQKMPNTDQLNNAYMDAAKTIQSEMDYGKVVKAIQ